MVTDAVSRQRGDPVAADVGDPELGSGGMALRMIIGTRDSHRLSGSRRNGNGLGSSARPAKLMRVRASSSSRHGGVSVGAMVAGRLPGHGGDVRHIM